MYRRREVKYGKGTGDCSQISYMQGNQGIWPMGPISRVLLFLHHFPIPTPGTSIPLYPMSNLIVIGRWQHMAMCKCANAMCGSLRLVGRQHRVPCRWDWVDAAVSSEQKHMLMPFGRP